MKITKHLKEILVGKLLGDAHLELNGKNYRFKFEHSIKQKEYVDWLYEKLKDFCKTPPKIRIRKYAGKTYYKYSFQTRSLPNFKFFGEQFYHENKKIIPKRILRKLLTPLSLAVWFMDDGSVKSSETRGRILNTQGFSEKEVFDLCTALNSKFGFHTKPRKQREGFQIFIPAGDANLLLKIISKLVLPYFYYKLPKKLD
jgi:hypothetical protein